MSESFHKYGKQTFDFDVKGQKGSIPRIGLGSVTLGGLGEESDKIGYEAVKNSILNGYRMIDTALLYNNQEIIGRVIKELIQEKKITREDLFITSKVACFPPTATKDNIWIPLAYHEENCKSYENTLKAVDLCLKKLELDYVDLMLIHSPVTDVEEFQASTVCAQFEMSNSALYPSERKMIMDSRKEKIVYDEEKAEKIREESWKALEKCQADGKCKFIGVSNYPPRQVKAMEKYANVMPCNNQLELHPKFSSPTLQAQAKEMNYIQTGYGSGTYCRLEKDNKILEDIAKKYNITTNKLILRWTSQNGIIIIPRSGSSKNQLENLEALDEKYNIDNEDMKIIDGFNEAHPFYWCPLTSQPKGTLPDL